MFQAQCAWPVGGKGASVCLERREQSRGQCEMRSEVKSWGLQTPLKGLSKREVAGGL